ncbi:MAG: hypothetical protein WDA02_06085 [Saccharofermentanales bacterium]
MKKFSSLNESNKIENTPLTKDDLIKNIINESLSISNGEILGKDNLINIINKIIKINECKTTIKTLENVKIMSRHSFSYQTINEAIENEKKNMDLIITEKVVKIEEIKNDKMINESQSDDDDDDVQEDEPNKECKDDDCDDDKKKISKKDKPEEEDDTEVVEKVGNNVHIPDYNNGSMKDILELSSLMEKIKNSVNEEHHLVSKNERIKFILEHIDKRGVKTVVLNYIKNHPIYIDTNNIEETLNKLNDKQVEDIYLKVEEVPSVIKVLDVPIKEHHLDSREDRVNFILDALDNPKVKGKIIEYISKIPSYVKTSDIDLTIHELNDAEVEELYLLIEEEIYPV